MLNTEEMGKRIKELRIEKGWTGIKMSTKIGVDLTGSWNTIKFCLNMIRNQ